MTKNIMSIAAAAALLTSGATAFETNSTGELMNISGLQGAYKTDARLERSEPMRVNRMNAQFGDALLFQAFNQRDAWGTEIVVRNNHPYAVVAKFVAYSGIDSQEVRDFNIYLSANDVFRCTIQDGMITTTDDSVMVGGPDAKWGDFENVTLADETGYVVVYAMAASEKVQIHTPKAAADGTMDPKSILKLHYEHALDTVRSGWRETYKLDGSVDEQAVFMGKGVYLRGESDAEINAPKVPNGDLEDTNLTNPNQYTLSGTVRIFNADEPRDLLLPAIASANYSADYYDGYTMLWAPRELAAFADRSIINGEDYDVYDSDAVVEDAWAYTVNQAYYTFNNATDTSVSTDLANKLVITQPEKRTLVQLDAADDFWTKTVHCPAQAMEDEKVLSKLVNGTTYGLIYAALVWDEAESVHTGEVIVPPELSPGDDLSLVPEVRCNEVAEIANVEAATDNAEKNGYAVVKFTKPTPAIITQMTASSVGDARRINWIEAPTATKPRDY